jgi:hypothetical protein
MRRADKNESKLFSKFSDEPIADCALGRDHRKRMSAGFTEARLIHRPRVDRATPACWLASIPMRQGHADSGLGALVPDIDEGCAGVAFV